MFRSLICAHASRHGLLSRVIFLAAQQYFLAYCRTDDYDMATNGELRFLKALASFGLKTVFDVGANKGEWTQAVLRTQPEAFVHAFELSPITAKTLADRFAGEPRVTVNVLGLSDRDGTIEIAHSLTDDTLTSLHSAIYDVSTTTVTAKLNTGSTYRLEKNIKHINLLKVDTEGNDLEVIRGFSSALETIDIIQFEYNELSWVRGIFIDAFVAALPGFRVGRLTNAGVIWDRSLIANLRVNAGNMVAVNNRLLHVAESLARF